GIIADNDAEMPAGIAMRLGDLEDRQELVRAQSQEGIALALPHAFQAEHLLVEGSGGLRICHLNGDMVRSVDSGIHLSTSLIVRNLLLCSGFIHSRPLRPLLVAPSRRFDRLLLAVIP